jgi:hypothetical protein
MELLGAYTKLQGKLQRYEEQGWITPCPDAERSRFLAFAEIDLIPLARRLATILRQAGISAYVAVELEDRNMWLGLFLDETRTRGLLLQSHDAAAMQLTVRFGWDPPVEEPHVLRYHRCTRALFASALERCIDRLITRPPL